MSGNISRPREGDSDAHTFELRPTSLTPRATVWFYGSPVVLMLAIALAYTAVGFWPVLPFAGAEAVMLYVVVSIVQRRARAREYIRVDDSTVVVEKVAPGRRGTMRRVAYAFKRPWTRIELRRNRPALWASQLLIRSQGKVIEIGAFLTDSEREGLGKRLKAVLEEAVPAEPDGKND
ncbi:MAG: DUF2244 domain-containing protein [Gammaproteobacteria bacterium]